MPPATRPAQPLRPGEHRSGFITPGDAHLFTLELQTGDAVLLEVDQGEVDLEVEILDRAGARLLLFDTPVGRKTSERVCYIGRRRGAHSVRLAPFGPAAGSFALELVRIQPATPADRSCALAAEEFMAAEARRRTGLPAPELAESYERVSGLWRDSGEPALAALALRQAGNQWHSLGCSPKAARCFRQGRSRAHVAGSAYLEVNLLNLLA
jgi:hypothetical protein